MIKFTKQDVDNLTLDQVPALLIAQSMGLLPEGPELLPIVHKLREIAHDAVRNNAELNTNPRMTATLGRIDGLVEQLEQTIGVGSNISETSDKMIFGALKAAKGERWAKLVKASNKVRGVLSSYNEKYKLTIDEMNAGASAFSNLTQQAIDAINEVEGTSRDLKEFMSDAKKYARRAAISHQL